MKIIESIENEDGSANLTMDLTPEEVKFFLQEGIAAVLKRVIQEDDPSLDE